MAQDIASLLTENIPDDIRASIIDFGPIRRTASGKTAMRVILGVILTEEQRERVWKNPKIFGVKETKIANKYGHGYPVSCFFILV